MTGLGLVGGFQKVHVKLTACLKVGQNELENIG